MLKTRIYKIFTLPALIMVLKLVSCTIYEDISDCSNKVLKLVVVDSISSENNIKAIDPISLFLFKSNKFVRVIEKEDKSGIYLIGYEKGDDISIAIWGNLKEDSVGVFGLKVGSKPEDIYIKPKSNGIISKEPSDLFYTSFMLDNDSDDVDIQSKKGNDMPLVALGNDPDNVDIRAGEQYEDTIVLYLKRKVSSVQIIGKHVTERFGNDTSGIHFRLKGAKNAINFKGILDGNEVIYSPYSFFNTDAELMTKVFKILPIPEEDYLTVELYRNDELLFSTNKDSKGNLFKPTTGKQLNITIDFYRTNATIKTVITPWGVTWQETTM